MFIINRKQLLVVRLALSILLLLSTSTSFIAHADDKVLGKEVVDGTDTSANTDTPLPDLFTGAMSYRIPIEVPTGRRGVDPGIVLTYKSSNGNGWIGVGWELEMGSIERSTKKGVNYAGSEFIMRGPGGATELVETSAASASPREFRAKIEGVFIRYIYYGSYWEAINKRGVRFRFGYSSTSRQSLDVNNTFKWFLDRITDKNGNYVSLSYTFDNGQLYLQQIDYSGNGTATPNLATSNRVIFNLEDRSDAPTLYTTNFAVKTAKRLKSIEIRANTNLTTSTLVRKYVLNYDAWKSVTANNYSPLTGRSVLASVTEYGSDGITTKPPIILDYSNSYSVPDVLFTPPTGTLNVLSYSKPSAPLPTGQSCVPGKFGVKNNLLCIAGSQIWDMSYLINNPADRGIGFSWPNYNRPASAPLPLTTKCMVGDFKGVGKSSLACNLSNNENWTILSASGTLGEIWDSESWNNAPAVFSSSACFTGDFDGNGKADVACNTTGSSWRIALSTGSSFGTTAVNWSGGPNLASIGNNCIPGDFNGDGKTELACNSGGTNNWTIYGQGSSNQWSTATWAANNITLPSLTNSNIYAYCVPGDFNGDGKSDIACYINSTWKIMLSTGSGWDTSSLAAISSFSTSNPISNKCLAGDFNSEGKTDIACYEGSGTWCLFH